MDGLQSTLDNNHECLHMVSLTLAIVVPCAHMHCSPRSHCVHCCALLYIGLRTLGNVNDVLHSTLDNGLPCLHMVTLTCGALCALLYDMEDGSLHA